MESNARLITPLEKMLADKLYYFGALQRHDYDMALTCAISDAKQVRTQILKEEYIIRPQDCSNDICLEAVLPYICKERDKALQKVEVLTDYAKGLEAMIEDLRSELEIVTKERDAVKAKEAKTDKILTERQRKTARKFLKQAQAAMCNIDNMLSQNGNK